MNKNRFGTIQNLAPRLAECFISEVNPKSVEKKYENFYKKNVGKNKLIDKYLWNGLHDSWILGINKSRDILLININDFTTHLFAEVLAKKVKPKLKCSDLIFPVRLIFKEVESYYIYNVDKNGRIELENCLGKDVDYIEDQLLVFQDNKIEVAFVVYDKSEKDKKKRAKLIFVSAKNLEIIEKQDGAWNNYFGKKFDQVYKRFKRERNKGRYFSSQDKCAEFLNKVL